MKIESNTHLVSKLADSATLASSSSNLSQANKLYTQLNGNTDVNRQYFNQPNSQQAMFKSNDLQALYKLHLNGNNLSQRTALIVLPMALHELNWPKNVFSLLFRYEWSQWRHKRTPERCKQHTSEPQQDARPFIEP